MNLSQNAGLTGLNAIAALYNGGTAQIYSGAMPASPGVSLSSNGVTNTLLATFTFSNPAFGSSIYDPAGYYKALASFAATSVTPVAPGTACFARMYQSGGSTVIEDRTLAQTWQAGMSAAVGQFVMAGANTYVCTQAGAVAGSGAGPSGTGANIQDGAAYWQFWNAGAPDILIADAVLSTTTPVTMPYFWLALPCR